VLAPQGVFRLGPEPCNSNSKQETPRCNRVSPLIHDSSFNPSGPPTVLLRRAIGYDSLDVALCTAVLSWFVAHNVWPCHPSLEVLRLVAVHEVVVIKYTARYSTVLSH